jgi:hypothetical protein
VPPYRAMSRQRARLSGGLAQSVIGSAAECQGQPNNLYWGIRPANIPIPNI